MICRKYNVSTLVINTQKYLNMLPWIVVWNIWTITEAHQWRISWTNHWCFCFHRFDSCHVSFSSRSSSNTHPCKACLLKNLLDQLWLRLVSYSEWYHPDQPSPFSHRNYQVFKPCRWNIGQETWLQYSDDFLICFQYFAFVVKLHFCAVLLPGLTDPML